MPDSYSELLDATIKYVRTLKDQGVKWLPLSSPAAVDMGSLVSERAKRPAQPGSPQAPATHASGSESAHCSADAVQPGGPVTKAEAIAELRQRTFLCQRCPHLAASRTNVVFGAGSLDAALMFVGEAPGADEDARGEPFVGAAGHVLTRIIKAMELSRDSVYIANILKCRPDTPAQSSGNRKPTHEEMQTCLPYLLEQVRLVQPQVIVALGATAMEGLFGKPTAISRARGRWHQYEGISVMPTYHPAYLLHNESLERKREVWEDMLAVLERLGLPISDKQRAYFTRARS
jgi:uracil-DNA glycosylase